VYGLIFIYMNMIEFINGFESNLNIFFRFSKYFFEKTKKVNITKILFAQSHPRDKRAGAVDSLVGHSPRPINPAQADDSRTPHGVVTTAVCHRHDRTRSGRVGLDHFEFWVK